MIKNNNIIIAWIFGLIIFYILYNVFISENFTINDNLENDSIKLAILVNDQNILLEKYNKFRGILRTDASINMEIWQFELLNKRLKELSDEISTNSPKILKLQRKINRIKNRIKNKKTNKKQIENSNEIPEEIPNENST